MDNENPRGRTQERTEKRDRKEEERSRSRDRKEERSRSPSRERAITPPPPPQQELPLPPPPPPPQQLNRIFTMHNNICVINTDPNVVNFYWVLLQLHGLIDMYHDQLDGGRGSDLKSKDTEYRKKGLIDNIAKCTFGNHVHFTSGSTNINKVYDTERNGVHTLQDALERNGDDFLIRVNNSTVIAPLLPKLMVTVWNCADGVYAANQAANQMVVYKRFDTDLQCNNQVAGSRVHEHTGINDPVNPEYGIVLDAGTNEVFQSIKGGADVRRNIMSGKLDSSSSSGTVTNIEPDKHQFYIPFMNIFDDDVNLIGSIMVYATWLTAEEVDGTGREFNSEDGAYENGHAVFLAFRFAGFDDPSMMYVDVGGIVFNSTRIQNVEQILRNEDWTHYLITSNVPDLPLISNYIAGTRGCFSYIKNILMGKRKNVCEPYKDVADKVFDKMAARIRQNTVFNNDPYVSEKDDFIVSFLMCLKHLGDKTRVIDAFILSEVLKNEVNVFTTTGTIDGFLMRFACLGNLYVYCANKNGGNLSVNDIRNIDPAMLEQMQTANAILECDNLKRRHAHYLSLVRFANGTIIEKLNGIVRNLTDTIDIIKGGILNPNNIKLTILTMSRRLISIQNASNNYKYKNGKIFSQEEMESIFKYYLVLVQHKLYLDLLLRNGVLLQTLVDECNRINELTCDVDNIQTTITVLNGFENTYGNLLKFLENCYSIDYFLNSKTYDSDRNVRNVVNDYAKFFRMNICAESSLKMVENTFARISDMVTPMLNFIYEINVTESVDRQIDSIYEAYRIQRGGRKTPYKMRKISGGADFAYLKELNSVAEKNYYNGDIISFIKIIVLIIRELNGLLDHFLHQLNSGNVPYENYVKNINHIIIFYKVILILVEKYNELDSVERTYLNELVTKKQPTLFSNNNWYESGVILIPEKLKHNLINRFIRLCIREPNIKPYYDYYESEETYSNILYFRTYESKNNVIPDNIILRFKPKIPLRQKTRVDRYRYSLKTDFTKRRPRALAKRGGAKKTRRAFEIRNGVKHTRKTK